MFAPGSRKASDVERPLRLALPKGRMHDGVVALLAGAGVEVAAGPRSYRPSLSLPGFETKVLKPQNVVEMLHVGSRDLGFAGADWAAELEADVELVLDTGLDPVRLVAAAPESILVDGRLPARPIVVASEFERLTRRWIASQRLDASLVRSYGATEVFPPEDADCVVDLAATGATLAANDLVVIDELQKSSTRLFASRATMRDPARRDAIERLALLLESVLVARRRVLVEVNVSAERLDAVVAFLPCMRRPTISPLHGGEGYAVKVVVPREDLPRLVPEIKARGGTDIVVSSPTQVVA